MPAGRRGGAGVAAGLVCLVALAVPSASIPPKFTRQIARGVISRVDFDRRAIDRLLDRRALAIKRRDRRAFMATVARDDAAFVVRQRGLFDNLDGVPLRSYQLKASWERAGDLATPALEARYDGAGDVALPVTEERYRISGYDEDPALEDLYYTFVKRGGRWLIGGDDDLEPLGLLSARHLWDFGTIVTSSSEHFLVLEHPGAGLGPGFLNLAESALTRVDGYWRVPWSRRVVVLVPSSEAELQRMLGVSFDVGDFVAFASSNPDPINGRGAARIIASPVALGGRPSSDVEDVLAHELLHVATRAKSGPFVPAFIEEGFAEYVGRGGQPAQEPGFASANGKLPTDSEFASGTQSDIFLRYQEARSAVAFFVRRFGFADFLRFYKRLGSRRVTAGTAGYHVDRTLRATIGIGYRTFEARWADSIEQ